MGRRRWQLRGALRALPLLLLGSGCGEVHDPSLEPVDDPRLDAPPPVLEARVRNPHRSVFWGDLHIHTAFSYDAYTLGVRALPDDAYRYAKGETIEHGVGYRIRARRPLDFAAVTDHAVYLGVARSRDESGEVPVPDLRTVLETRSPLRITWHFIRMGLFRIGSHDSREETFGGADPVAARSAWQEIVAAAERHHQPGRFTTFVGYEWTSMPDEENLHRNVIYRSAQVPEVPVSSLDSQNPEDLWRALEAQRAEGMEMIAIPHNGNTSNGRMYERVTFDGSPMDAAYAEARMRNEPISEILQVKGQSETHPLLSSEDEFASFELYDQKLSVSTAQSLPRGSYARDALKTGLELSAREGFNPYRFGVIGSSDSHNASSSVEEDNYHGKLPLIDGTVGLRLGTSLLLPENQVRGVQWSAAGLAAVWAEENTRAALFEAMRRKETYATSGPRIAVRFFAGFAYPDDLVARPDFVERAYAGGVPMGGALAAAAGSETPRFAVFAARDPLGANLDRIQIVKGWVDGEGVAHERVFDVAGSDGRVPDRTSGRLPAVGNTVDVEQARYENRIGATQLTVLWSDPTFVAAQEAFYYARVIEIPTPRWSTYDAVALGVPPPEPATLQERAITSAIWVRPAVAGDAPAAARAGAATPPAR